MTLWPSAAVAGRTCGKTPPGAVDMCDGRDNDCDGGNVTLGDGCSAAFILE